MIDIVDGVIIPELIDALYKAVNVNCLFGLASVYYLNDFGFHSIDIFIFSLLLLMNATGI
jgi:hypothetical protein